MNIISDLSSDNGCCPKILLQNQLEMSSWRWVFQGLLIVPISHSSISAIEIQSLHNAPKPPLTASKFSFPPLSKLILFSTEASINIYNIFIGFNPGEGPWLTDGIMFSLTRLYLWAYNVIQNLTIEIASGNIRKNWHRDLFDKDLELVTNQIVGIVHHFVKYLCPHEVCI